MTGADSINRDLSTNTFFRVLLEDAIRKSGLAMVPKLIIVSTKYAMDVCGFLPIDVQKAAASNTCITYLYRSKYPHILICPSATRCMIILDEQPLTNRRLYPTTDQYEFVLIIHILSELVAQEKYKHFLSRAQKTLDAGNTACMQYMNNRGVATFPLFMITHNPSVLYTVVNGVRVL